jgi:hypothetical protein
MEFELSKQFILQSDLITDSIVNLQSTMMHNTELRV